MIVPTFDDSRRMSVVDQWSVPFSRCVSLYVCSFADADASPERRTRVCAPTLPCSIAVPIVMSLFVEPGSNRSVSGRFVASPARAACAGSPVARALHRRHREHVAGLHVDDHRHAALGRGRGDLVDERLLDLVLQRLVDA